MLHHDCQDSSVFSLPDPRISLCILSTVGRCFSGTIRSSGEFIEVETENESEWALRGGDHWGAGLPCCTEEPPVFILIASERVSLSGSKGSHLWFMTLGKRLRVSNSHGPDPEL